MSAPWVVVGIDNGGTSNNATVLTSRSEFLVDRLVEVPSRVAEGTAAAVDAMESALDTVLDVTGTLRSSVRAVGLDTPGPASADGVISSRGSTNFSDQQWWGFDIRGALEDRLGVPVVYNNDGNAAALYAHHEHFGTESSRRSSVAAIVGTGLGGGVVERGQVVRGAAGMAGELGHVMIPMQGLLEPDQPLPQCNCGNVGDAESVASLTGILKNLLPYWLSRYPDHPLAAMPIAQAAKSARGLAAAGDELALKVFEQQAIALGRLFTIAAQFETEAAFRSWFVDTVLANTSLRAEQRAISTIELIPHLDMAGARGAAVAALAVAARHPTDA
jgi:glucokinase